MNIHTLSSLELLSLASTSNTTSKATERNDLLVFGDISKVGVCLGEFHATKGSSNFAHVLEVGAEVLPAGAGSYSSSGGQIIALL